MRAVLAITMSLGLCLACTPGRVGEDPVDAGGGGGMDADVELQDGDVVRRDGDVDGEDSGDGVDSGIDPDRDGAVDERDGSVGGTEGSCDNGVDDDGDGDMDCEDIDCFDEVCNASGLRCVNDTCGGCVGAASETSCGDGLDEDCDNLVDCADPDCDGVVCGPGDVVCASEACPCVSGFNEALCGDNTDDDCDGLTDCEDDDCNGMTCGVDGEVCLAEQCICPGAGGMELCNGVDDNCTGSIDEGCPNGVGGCCETNLFPVGGFLGLPFAELCASGQALVGVTTWVVSGINGLQPICADVTFVHDEDTNPEDSFTVVSGTPTDGAVHGVMTGTMERDVCPENEWVIGVFGDADMRVDRIGLRCGSVSIQRGGGFNWGLTVTPTGTTPARGSGFGDPYDARCAGGALMVGLDGRADVMRVHRLGFTCQRVELLTR